MKTLTIRQQQIFDALVGFQKQHGYPPTQKEVARLMGAKSLNAAAELLQTLEKKGVVNLAKGVARGITINTCGQEEEAICLLRSMVNGEAQSRENAVEFLQSRGVQL